MSDPASSRRTARPGCLSLRLPHGGAVVALAPRTDHIACRLALDDPRDEAVAISRCRRLPGLGPWTVEMIAKRALGHPDAFPATDLGVIKAARALGLPTAPAALATASAPWHPWRAYAVQHLWATGEHAVNRMPPA